MLYNAKGEHIEGWSDSYKKDQVYLIDRDKDLAEILLGRSDEIKAFNEMNVDDKIDFIKSILNRMKPYIDESENAFATPVDRDDSPRMLGTYYDRFVRALNIYTKDAHTEWIGWKSGHGEVFEYYENMGGGLIFVSYFSDAHPEKELKQKWEFMKTDKDRNVNMDKLLQMQVTSKKITSIQDTINKITK
jgi:hypothetical protein